MFDEDMFNEDTIGSPDTQADYIEQQIFEDNCAVAAEGSIIRQFGIDLSQEDAAYISAENGWYQPGRGTAFADIGNLMDLHNIENHTVTNASIGDLARELQQGHGVIIGVNSNELLDSSLDVKLENFFLEAFGLDTAEFTPANHAVTVTGMSDSPEGVVVHINDTGVGEACTYPLDKFMDAWENGNFNYTATDDALPSTQNFLGSTSHDEIDWEKWIKLGTGAALAAATLINALNDFDGCDGCDSMYLDDDFMRNI